MTIFCVLTSRPKDAFEHIELHFTRAEALRAIDCIAISENGQHVRCGDSSRIWHERDTERSAFTNRRGDTLAVIPINRF